MDGKRTPLDGRQLKRYIASMREVVEGYKKTMLEMIYWKRIMEKTIFYLKNLFDSEIMPIFAARMRVAYRRDDIKFRNRSLYIKPQVEYLWL